MPTTVTTDPELILGVEGVKEEIMEILQQHPTVQELVMKEFRDRFPTLLQRNELMSQVVEDEIVNLCQLIVWRRILGEI